MNLKVIGSVFQIDFNPWQNGKAAQHEDEAHERYGVKTGAKCQTDDAGSEQRHRCGQSLDLTLGSEQDGVGAYDGNRNDHGRGENRKLDISVLTQIDIQEHGHRRGQ
jgi:hypothetical protein